MDDRGVDRLFTLPLSEFVSARNALAKAIKAQGDKETAQRILALPKPSISAWAINQLVRRQPVLIRALLSALDRQKELQLAGLGGEVDRSSMKEAKQAENEALGKIERALVPILEEGGHASGRVAIEKGVKSIRAAATHPDGRPLLENGHLTIDFDTIGFDALGAGEERPHLRLIPTMEDKRKEKEDRLEKMRRQRIEAQKKIEEEQRRFARPAEQRREEDRGKAEERDRVKETVSERPDIERVKRTAIDPKSSMRDLERVKQTASEAKSEAPDPERNKETLTERSDVNRVKQSARFGEVAKILGVLRIEHARLEEQSIQLEDQVALARSALERAQSDVARAKEELREKAAQITQLEQLLGRFDDEDDA